MNYANLQSLFKLVSKYLTRYPFVCFNKIKTIEVRPPGQRTRGGHEMTFKELAKRYEETWRKADAEKKATGKVSRATTRELIRLEKELNK